MPTICKTVTKQKRSFILFIAILVTILICALFPQALRAEENSKLKLPSRTMMKPQAKTKWNWTPNVLLIMPNHEKPDEEFKDTIAEVKGHIIKTIGEGELLVYVVKFDSTDQFVKAESKLMRDQHCQSVQRDYIFSTQQTSVTDPYFSSEWHLGALNVVKAWSISMGGQNPIGVIDSGVNGSITELAGKTYSGYDAVNNRMGQSDVQGHGTMVSTTAAANTNNRVGTAAPARLARIYPVRAGFSDGSVSGQAILNGIYKCGTSNVKIINISANGNPPYTLANKSVNGTLHTYFKWYHDTTGGIIFNSAGNSGTRDANPLVPYLVVVSAIDTSYSLASFSTYGNCVWFTAPGTNIYCSNKSGKVVSVNGTSFSSPLVASIGALIWGAKSTLKNTDVERILKNTCYKAGSSNWTQWYGYGMPNAEAAMKSAKGL